MALATGETPVSGSIDKYVIDLGTDVGTLSSDIADVREKVERVVVGYTETAAGKPATVDFYGGRRLTFSYDVNDVLTGVAEGATP